VTRLRYSERAYLRSLEMSLSTAFVFVEGGSDRFFYEQICVVTFDEAGVTSEVRLGQELPSRAGGKAALLEFHDYAKRAGRLESVFKGKSTVLAFMLDKDVDDYLRRLRRSAHIIYTEHYEVENYLYRHGDIIAAGAAAAALSQSVVRAAIGDPVDWRHQVAEEWRSWVQLCLLCRTLGINHAANYRVSSQIQAVSGNQVDEPKRAQMLKSLETASKLSVAEFERRRRRAERFVDNRYARHREDDVYRGKWYTARLGALLKETGRRVPPYDSKVEPMLPKLLAMNLDYAALWSATLRTRLRALWRAS
jgi:hypothetical protein